MKVNELSRSQLDGLKQNHLSDHLMETEGRTPSWMELAEASETVPDSVILEEYAGTVFSEDDFFCTAGSRAGQKAYCRVSDGWFTYFVCRATGEKKFTLDPGDVEVPAEPDDFIRNN